MVDGETAKYVYHLGSSALTSRLPMRLEDLKMKCVKDYVLNSGEVSQPTRLVSDPNVESR